MHVAIIMDGNGRWAVARGLPRGAGHHAGAKAVDRAVAAAARRGIRTLTLYAFSAANWQRPDAEVKHLFALFRRYLRTQTQRAREQSIRINVIGRRDRLPPDLRQAIEASEAATMHCSRMDLRIAVDYSAQHSLMTASLTTGSRLPADASAEGGRAEFVQRLAEVDHALVPTPDVDLLIRTGGEKRLSDFLLWECAYAELLFLDCMWPDFDERAFADALDEFAGRQRRFGRIDAVACVEVAHA
jgi:undecaprenyl diphosphate synthase